MNFKIKHLFMINTIIAFVFGLGFLFMPDLLATMLGFSDQADGPTVFRFFGGSIIGVGILTFLVRNEEFSHATKSVAISQSINLVLLNVLLFIFGDLTNLMIWFTIVLHFILVVAYCYFLFKK